METEGRRGEERRREGVEEDDVEKTTLLLCLPNSRNFCLYFCLL